MLQAVIKTVLGVFTVFYSFMGQVLTIVTVMTDTTTCRIGVEVYFRH